jgi:hypothetical protein
MTFWFRPSPSLVRLQSDRARSITYRSGTIDHRTGSHGGMAIMLDAFLSTIWNRSLPLAERPIKEVA